MKVPARPWWKDPLVGFALVGAAIHLLLPADPAPLPDADASKSRIVVVDDARRNQVRADWTQEMGRPPSEQELHTAIGAWVKREVRVREAIRLGLDESDPVIRARLANKMAFVATSTEPAGLPTETELHALYSQHPERYQRPTRITLRQLFTGPDEEAAERIRLEWIAGADPRELHVLDPPGGPVLRGRTPEHLAERYGEPFADALDILEPGVPTLVESTAGWHVVAIESVDRGGDRPFEAVRDRVALHWQALRRHDVAAQADARLLEAYEVVGWSP